MDILLVKKNHEDATTPRRQTAFSAGYDLSSVETIDLQPGHRYAVDTGLSMAIPKGYYGRVAPRSGLAVKSGLDVLAGVIDSDYTLTVKVVLINLGQEAVHIKSGDRIAQLIIEKCLAPEVRLVDSLPPPDSSDPLLIRRGGFGSTGLSGKGPDGTAMSCKGPDGTGPDGTGPDGTGPDGRGPDGRGPDGRGPDGRGPDGRVETLHRLISCTFNSSTVEEDKKWCDMLKSMGLR